MGGTVLASWNCEADIGRMELIDGVVLERHGSSHIIGKALLFPRQKQRLIMTTYRC